jgi:hypothetical protein
MPINCAQIITYKSVGKNVAMVPNSEFMSKKSETDKILPK